MHPRLASIALVVAGTFLILAEPGAGQQKPTRSPFAGEYSGPFLTKSLRKGSQDNDKGTYTITVAVDGKVTGNTLSSITKARTSVTGTVDPEGKVIFTIKYGSQEYMMKGTVTKTTAGALKGSLLQYSGREAIAQDDIELRPK